MYAFKNSTRRFIYSKITTSTINACFAFIKVFKTNNDIKIIGTDTLKII